MLPANAPLGPASNPTEAASTRDEELTPNNSAVFLPPSAARQGQMIATPSVSSIDENEGEDEEDAAAGPVVPLAGQGMRMASDGTGALNLERGELQLNPSLDFPAPSPLELLDQALTIDPNPEGAAVPWWIWPMLGSVAGAVWLSRKQQEDLELREEEALRELLL